MQSAVEDEEKTAGGQFDYIEAARVEELQLPSQNLQISVYSLVVDIDSYTTKFHMHPVFCTSFCHSVHLNHVEPGHQLTACKLR